MTYHDATYPRRDAILGRRCSGPDAGTVDDAAMPCARVWHAADEGSEFVSGFRAKTRRRLGRGRSAGPSAPRYAGVNLVRGG